MGRFTLGLALLGLALSVKAIEVREELPGDEARKALQAACTALQGTIPCPPVPPVVLTTSLPAGFYGLYYPGSRLVFISERLWGPHWDTYGKGVLVHEMVHYMVSMAGLELTTCENEGYAWAAFNDFVMSQYRPDLRRDKWKELYECPE